MTNSDFLRNSESTWNGNSSEEATTSKHVKEKQERYDNNLKVYIKNLPLDDQTSYESLMENFASCGKVQHQHFFEKRLAGQRIQQGLVVFSSEEEAERATKLTGTVVGKRHIIVSKYRQFSQHTSKMVHVSNLSVDVDEESLWNFFENCGTIKFIHINRPLNASSLKGEVHFKSEKEAKKASKLSGQLLEGNKITVSFPSENQEQQMPSKEYPVFVAGLPRDIQKEDLLNFFGECGPIKRIKIIVKEEEEEGHAVLYFMDSESAENALSCSGNELSGYVISVTQREEGMLQYQFLNPVFLAGISKDTKDVDIFLKFQNCGLIHDIKFVQSKPGSLKKCCIEFMEPEGANKAFAVEDLELKGQHLLIGRTREVWSGQHPAPKPKKRKLKQEHQMAIPAESSSTTVIDNSEGKKKKKKKNKQETDALNESLSTSVMDNSIEKKKKKKNKTD